MLEAILGFVWGNLLALALAAITLILPKLDTVGSQSARLFAWWLVLQNLESLLVRQLC